MARISEETAAAIVTRVKRKMLPICGVCLQVFFPGTFDRAVTWEASWKTMVPDHFQIANDHPEPFQ